MNDADLMSSAYASYAQNVATLGVIENHSLIDQLQTLLKSNGVQAHSSGALQRKLSTEQNMDPSSDRDDGVRPSCRFCGKTFAQASYIKAHERLHTGEKPYICSVCNKAFSDASNWKKHERMHSRQIQSAFDDGVVSVVTSAPPTPEPMTPNSPTGTLSSMSQLSLPSFAAAAAASASRVDAATRDAAMVSINSQLSSFVNNMPQLSLPIPQSIVSNVGLGSLSSSVGLGSLSSLGSLNSLTSFPGMFPEVTSSVSMLSQGISLSHGLTTSQNTQPSSSNSQNSEDSNDLSPPAKRSKIRMGRLDAEAEKDELSCSVCGKTFSTPASLSMHKKIHSGEKPHTCSTCGKSFTQIGTLRAHERVHTGEKPYECNICGKTFAQCGSFRMHERRHHRDMMENFQKCFVCGAGFNSIDELQKHLMCHPGALSMNLHPGAALGFPGSLPLGFGYPPDMDGGKSPGELVKPDLSEMSDMEKAFSFFSGQPKSAPVATLSEHFHLPPFASTAHALIQRSLSQGNDPNTAVSMLLASNGPENLSFLGQSFASPGIITPTRLPFMPPERTTQSATTTQESIKPEEVEPVSTTTRSRKYSSDSHTSADNAENQASDLSSESKEKRKQADRDQEDGIEGEGDRDQDREVPSHSLKTPSEDSSLAESRSTEDFQSDDQNGNGTSGSGVVGSTGGPLAGISRRNLNKRMMVSAVGNSRKQRRPMRRLSTTAATAILDQNASYQQSYNNEVGGEDCEEEEELTKDQLMVSFLLAKGEVYKCKHCHIIFEDCSLYLLHNGLHSNDRDPFKCVICKKQCEGRVEFNCHLTSHIKQ